MHCKGDYMKKYDYSFLKIGSIPANTLVLLSSLIKVSTESNGVIREYTNIFDSLTKIAIAQSVESSNAIEGIVTTDKRIKGLLEGTVSPINHDEREILGYKDALNIIHRNYSDLRFNEEEILSLHKTMLSYEMPFYAGKYKEQDNVIMAVSKDGIRSIRFRPISAEETPQAMKQLFFAYMDYSHDSSVNPLLLIPCIILDFLCIHPFSDGNGRMSRLLSLLLLYKNHYTIGKYVSFENQINLYKNEYYEALRLSSNGWEKNENSYFPFIDNFLSTLLRCYRELNGRFDILNEKYTSKKDRIKETILKSIVPISRKELQRIWPDIAPDTIKKALIELQNEGIIQKVGNYKDAKYKGINN